MWSDAQLIPREQFAGNKRDEYRPDIDGLRCIAVMLVLLFHFDLPEGFRSGFIGVDIFFVISGFLIVPPIVSQLEARTFSFGRFYERRIRRLAPALLATTALTLAVAILVLTPIELTGLAKEAIAAQLYVSNVYYWRYLNYFGVAADGAFLLHTWSLGVEEQFYLTFPFALWLTAKVLPRRLLLTLAVIGFLSFGLNLVFVDWKPQATFYLLPTRAWEFAAGAFVPQLTEACRRFRIGTAGLVLAGSAALIAALLIYEPTTSFPGWYATLPVLSTVLLLAAGADQRGIYHRAISSIVPRYLGRISYELYLVHWPIKIFAPLLIAEIGYAVRLSELLLTMLLAAGIYHLIEAPIRGRRIVQSARSLVLAYAISTLAIVALFTAALITRGFPNRFDQRILALARGADDFDDTYRACEGNLRQPCVIGRKSAPPTWFVYGDSHADALAGAFSDYFTKRGLAAYFSFHSGCLPLANTDSAECRAYNRDVERFVAENPILANVVIVSTWTIPNGFIGDEGRLVKGADTVAPLNRSLDHTLAAFKERHVAIWLPVPGALATVPGTLARNAIFERHWDLRMTKGQYAQNSAYLRAALQRHPDVSTIDPGSRICRTGLCDVEHNGRALYYDNAHPAASQRAFYESLIAKDLDKILAQSKR